MCWPTHNKLPNEPIANPMIVPKEATTSRVYLINPNGVDIRKGGGWEQICSMAKRTGIDLLSIVEHKLDTTKAWVRKRLQEGATKVFGGKTSYRLNLHSTPIESENHRKPGGILQLVTGSDCGRIHSTFQDPYGRWVSTTFNRTGRSPMTLISTYQAVKSNHRTAGASTYFTQLYSQHKTEGRVDAHKVRRHHSHDLVEYVQSLQQDNHSLIIAGDFNESLDSDGAGMTRLCTQCNLVDPILTLSGETEFATYIRGTTVIDYILVSTDLMPAIKRCGYEPFQAHFVGDHRGVYLDIETEALFGDLPPLAKLSSRDLVSTKPHQITQYWNHKCKHLDDHNWFAKVKQLQTSMKLEVPNTALANELYDRLIVSCAYAGKRLPKFKNAPYSPALVRQRNLVKLLETLQSHYNNPYDLSGELHESISKLGSLKVPIPQCAQSCQQALQRARKELSEILKKEVRSQPLRKAHLEECLQSATAKGDSKRAKAIRGMQQAEDVSKVYNKLKAIRNKIPSSGLSSLQVPVDPSVDPKQCDEWKTIETPEEIRLLLQERNRAHFGQSKDCNLTSSPTDFTMEFTATCKRAEAILNGTFPTDNLDELTKIFLEALKFVSDDDIDAIPPDLSSEEFLGKIKAWKESTSTSPGTNMHLGHMKAYVAKHDLLEDSEEATTLEENRQAVLDGHLTLLNYALQFGHSYDPWKMIVNTMIEKEPGNPRIHRLRVIHLYEADFNLILGVKWRALLRRACDKGYVNASQFGSQPGKEALDAVFLRELEYEIARLTRKKVIHFDNDATSCYDRIPCFLANVVSRKFGMHRRVCIVHGTTLAEARYHLKTKLGISEEFVQHCRAHPLFGTGQGSGNSPMYWLFISSTLFDVYESKATGATYESHDKTLSITIYIVGFVDDTRNTENQFTAHPQPPTEALIAQTILDSQLWHDLLETSNQALELPKCGFHVIEFEFAADGTPKLVEHPNIPALTLKDSNSNEFTIQHWPTTKATKYLGCFECPVHKKAQLEAIKKKCRDYCRILNSCHLTPKETHILFRSIYRLSVGYPLPMCYFTFSQLDQAQRKVERAFIAKMGFNRNTSKAVLRGPKFLGGAGLFHLYDDQSYGQLKFLLKNWRSPDSPGGQMTRIAMSWVQFCAGVSWPVLEQPQTRLVHLESKWFSSIRTFLSSIDATVQLQDVPIAKPQRENDQYIMDAVLQHGKFKPCEIRRINYCRMYLNVILLSDIATPGGRELDRAMYNGNPINAASTGKCHFVEQANPNGKAWQAWRKAMHVLFCKKRSLKLHHRFLGRWLHPAPKLHRYWKVYYQPDGSNMYQLTAAGFTRHPKMRYSYDGTAAETVPELPPGATPCDFRIHQSTASHATGTNIQQTTLSMTRHQPIVPSPEQPTTDTFQAKLLTLELWEQLLFHTLEWLVPEEDVWDALCTGQCILVSDGSAPLPRGSFAWILSDPTGRRLVQCSGPAYGYRIGSYRAEGYGILSGYRFLWHMELIYGWPPMHQPRMSCDNKAMVEICVKFLTFDVIYPNATLYSEWDIIAEIRATGTQLGALTPTLTHVKGHQDKNKSYDELPLKAQLNIDADELCGHWLTANPDWNHSIVPLLPTSGSQLNTLNGTITRSLRHELQLARTLPPLKAHMIKKYYWSESSFQDIHWDCHGRALKRLEKHSTTLIKYLNNITPVGTMAHKYDKKYPLDCPSCNFPEEDMDHLLHCPKRKAQREIWFQAILKYTQDKPTAPPLQDMLLNALRALLDNTDLTEIEIPDGAEDVALAQAAIGWEHLLKGRFSKEWATAHDNLLGPHKNKRNNGEAWLTGLIQLMLQQWFDLWQARNADRHGRDAISRAYAKRQQAIREITLMYETYQGNVLPEDEQHFQDVTLLQRIQQPTNAMRMWINSWSKHFQASLKAQQESDSE